ncbi:hypothetical protein [uncultured Aquimarina sp.]|uniref:hypothetical protein n=1 Tax=uncultured Aquimarina sp. TaxID=575652 RepID=UPI0026152ACE|nr:hypothetical protein [uncultured Aquimarina sp.]
MKRTLNIILLLVVIFMTTGVSAQKVKLKKGVVFIDKKEIPVKVVSEGKSVYSFVNLSNGETFLTTKYFERKITDTKYFRWLEVSKEGADFINEVDLEVFSWSMNVKKTVAEFVLKGLEFFDNQGVIDNAKIDDFFSEKRVRVAEREYEGKIQRSIDSIKGVKEERARVISEDIARQQNELEQAKQANEDEIQKRIKDYEQKNFIAGHVFNRDGYVVDENGEKFEGKLFWKHKYIPDPKIPQDRLASYIHGFPERDGKTVDVIMYDEEAGYSSKIIRAKKEGYFAYMPDKGDEVVYRGLNIMKLPKEMIPEKFDVDDQKVEKDRFCKERFRGEGISIYQEFPKKDLLIKSENRKLAFKFILSDKDLNRKILEKYLDKCTLGDKIDTVDFTSVQEVKELINFYNNSCN